MRRHAKGTIARVATLPSTFACRIGFARILLLAGILVLAVAGQVRAEEPAAENATGLPQNVRWTFNLNAGLGGFGFGVALSGGQRLEQTSSTT